MRAYQAIVAVGRGDHSGARDALGSVRNDLDAERPPYGAELVALAASLLAEAGGDDKEVFRLLLGLWEHDVAHDIRYYHRYLAPRLVRLAIVLDDRTVATGVTELAEAAAALAAEVPSVQSAALRCRGLLENDAERLVDAVGLALRSGRVLDHAGACEDAAGVLAEIGNRSEAKDLLAEAMARYEAVEARAWEARTSAALRRLGVRQGARGPRRRPASGWASLTTTERDVSQLVAEGLTNREVAKRLHVSPHTVNTHLRHVFEKLSVSNRAELAATVARSTTSPP